jgi:hypothetical protein
VLTMSRRIALVPTLFFVVFVSTAVAVPSNQPSDRRCLIAWNAASNHANHSRLITARPVSGVSVRAGTTYTDTVTVTKKAITQTSAKACLLTVAKAGTIQIVTGRWNFDRVSRWSWGRAIPTTIPFAGNVRLLSDGRITKIYRR